MMDKFDSATGYKPVPKPRKLSLNVSVSATETGQDADDVFTEDHKKSENSLEEIQNEENDMRLKGIRNKSYANAIAAESLDVAIPGSESTEEDGYLAMGMGLIANVAKSKERPTPAPRPKPSKSQSVDDIKSKDKAYPENQNDPVWKNKPIKAAGETAADKVTPSRAAPPIPVKPKPGSDSDVTPQNASVKSKDNHRPRSTTWYDADSALKPKRERSVVQSEMVSSHSTDDVKLPTRKEKHSSFFGGSSIFETLKSWTVGSGVKSEKTEPIKKDRSSKFYFNVADEDSDKVKHQPGEVTSRAEYTPHEPVRSDSDRKSVQSADEAPPLPPPRTKKKKVPTATLR